MKTQSLRALALDVGDARVGVAVSDPSGFLASPLKILKREPGTVDAVVDLVKSMDIQVLVVGLPLNMDGSHGFQAKKVERFAGKVKDAVKAAQPEGATEIELVFEDERESTVDARALRLQRGTKMMKRRERIDAEAAAIFLQAYLDRKKP